MDNLIELHKLQSAYSGMTMKYDADESQTENYSSNWTVLYSIILRNK